MTVERKISVDFKCDCHDCRYGEFAPYCFHAKGDSVEECYKQAVKEGWIFLQGKTYLHCFRKECLMEEEECQ